MTKKDIQEELKQAMLAKDTVKTSALRMLISAIGYYEIEKALPAGRQDGADYSATDEDVQTVIQKEAKKIRDSIEQYKSAGRNDLVEKESEELSILGKYLPEQMNDEEIRKLATEAIAQTGVSTLSDMGKVMGVLMPKTKGKADGTIVSKIVREELTK